MNAIIPALMTGNAARLKSTRQPLLFAEDFVRAGLPPLIASGQVQQVNSLAR